MSTTASPDDRSADDREVLPEVLEWLVGAVIAIGGLLLALGGSALLLASDEQLIREAIAAGVADGSIQLEGLTQAQLTALVSETAFWVSIGLLVTGLGLVVVAVVYLIGRRRTRRASGPGSAREVLFAHGLIGALATGLLFFLPVSPVFGGGIAGYVHRRAGSATKAGAVSGLLAALPIAVIGSFLAIGFATGLDGGAIQGIGPIVALAVIIGVFVALVYSVGLGALGGYIAAVIVDDDRKDSVDDGARLDAERSSDDRPDDSVDAPTSHDPISRGERDGDATADRESDRDATDARGDRR